MSYWQFFSVLKNIGILEVMFVAYPKTPNIISQQNRLRIISFASKRHTKIVYCQFSFSNESLSIKIITRFNKFFSETYYEVYYT